jgi:hypothetical protein
MINLHRFGLAGYGKSRFGKKVRKINRAQLPQEREMGAGDDFVSPRMPPISPRTDFFRSLLGDLRGRTSDGLT